MSSAASASGASVRAFGATSASAYLFCAPAFALLMAMIVLPTLVVLGLSFTDYRLGARLIQFVGLQQYGKLLQDPDFWRALKNSAVYAAIVVPGSSGAALLLALLIHDRRKTRRFYEILYFLPVTSTLTAMSIVWSFILNGRIGPLAELTARLGLGRIDFFADAHFALLGLALIGIWHSLGFNVILFLAGLTTIPAEVKEAAALDGIDGFWDRLRHLIWPLLAPTTIVVLVINSIQSFQVFDTVAVLTHGGPNGATDMLLFKTYTDTFNALKIGYGSALTVVFLALLALFSILQVSFLDRRAHYR